MLFGTIFVSPRFSSPVDCTKSVNLGILVLVVIEAIAGEFRNVMSNTVLFFKGETGTKKYSLPLNLNIMSCFLAICRDDYSVELEGVTH